EIGAASTGTVDRLNADLAGAFADGARVEARDLGGAPPCRARLGQEPTAARCQHGEQTNNNRADQNAADARYHSMENASTGVNASSTLGCARRRQLRQGRYGYKIVKGGSLRRASPIEMILKAPPVLVARSAKEHILGLQRFGPQHPVGLGPILRDQEHD